MKYKIQMMANIRIIFFHMYSNLQYMKVGGCIFYFFFFCEGGGTTPQLPVYSYISKELSRDIPTKNYLLPFAYATVKIVSGLILASNHGRC
jgi:hypothetical protein